MERGYQHNFSEMVNGAMYNRSAREKKARTILAVIQDFLAQQQASSFWGRSWDHILCNTQGDKRN